MSSFFGLGLQYRDVMMGVKPRKRRKTEKYGFSELVSVIESTEIVSKINEITKMFSMIIAEMSMELSLIDIDIDTMILNISKEEVWSDYYGIKNLFVDDGSTYCSSTDSGNCVDLLLDLKHEYTFKEFHVSIPRTGFTCPVKYAYFWVFGGRNSEREITKLCKEEIYAKQKYEPLSIKFDVIDPMTNERKRDEMTPVCFIEATDSEMCKFEAEIASHIKGRYVLVKLIAGGIEESNVDCDYVGLKGYRM